MKETRMQREKRQHRELMNNIVEVRQYDYTEGYKIVVKYASEVEEVTDPETEEAPASYEVETVEEAWSIANKLFTSDYEYSTEYSSRAGYDVYMSTAENNNDHISDLGSRLEVNIGLQSINIWIKPKQQKTTPAPTVKKTFNKYSSFAGVHTTPALAFKINMQYFAVREPETVPETQQYTSANTSINSKNIPVVFSTLIEKSIKLNINPANSIILDSGCGKYPEIISEYLLDSGCEYAGRDPYNQPEFINNIVFPTKCKNAEVLKKNRIFTSSNVLNVIPGLNNRIAYINSIKDIMQPGEKLYITVYPGDCSGIGRPTAEDCWQENRKYKDYIPELEAAGFTSVMPKYGMLIATL